MQKKKKTFNDTLKWVYFKVIKLIHPISDLTVKIY